MISDDDRTQEVMVLTQGTMINHYRIVRKIGSGGMGDVYLAEDTTLNRRVALKFLAWNLCQSVECRARFKQEAQAAAKLGHANIVAVYEVGEFRERPFFAMEYVEGQPLDRIIESGPLAEREVIELALGLCNGLRKAHESGVIHRDVKPSNIIVDHDSVPRLLDFGLAALSGIEGRGESGSILGTIGYMSPEQVQGEPSDHRSDLFSLGVVLYEAISGNSPFRCATAPATLNAIAQKTPEPLARYNSDVVSELQRIVSKLLQKDPAQRYQAAAEVIDDLERLKFERQSGARVPAKTRRRGRLIIVAAALALLAVATYAVVKYGLSGAGNSPTPRKMLAVLPFDNLGAPDDEYFADGMTEEITTDLAAISGLGVISRTSSMQYKKTAKSLRQIGKELDVDYILEGTIRWERQGAESRVRINPYLIRVSDDLHLWADKYDAVLTDVFSVQSAIAHEVATALEITLLQGEQEALARKREIDPLAYEYYLKGKQYFSIAGFQQKEARLAERMQWRAIEQAPEFAEAYAELGCIYTELYWSQPNQPRQLLDSAQRMIDKAAQLAPNLPETHQARGWYYYHGRHDFDRALEEFERVIALQPNNVLAKASIAWVQRRQGKWEEATAGLESVVRLDPLDDWYQYELGMTYHCRRRYLEAIAQFEKVLDLQPSHRWAYVVESWSTLNETGDLSAARAILERGRAANGRWPELTWLEVYYDLCDQKYDQALSLLTKRGDVLSPENPDSSDYYFLKGFTYALMGRLLPATTSLDSARRELESRMEDAEATASQLSSIAIVYAQLGLAEQALAAANRAVELNPVAGDALSGPTSLRALAFVYATLGMKERAIETIDQLLSIPANVSVKTLRISPELRVLHGDPGFEAVMKKHAEDDVT